MAGTSPGHDGRGLLRCEYAFLPVRLIPFLLRRACFTWGSREDGEQFRRRPMAMTMSGEVQLAASRDVVWTKLNDPEVLKACIPGCEELEKTEDNGFRAVAKMKV